MLDRVSSGWVHYKLDRGVDHADRRGAGSSRGNGTSSRTSYRIYLGRGARGVYARCSRSATRSSRSFRFRAPRHQFDARRALQRKFEGAGLKFDPVSFTIRSVGAGDPACGRSGVSRAGYLSQHPCGRYGIDPHALADAGPARSTSGSSRKPTIGRIPKAGAPFDGVAATSRK